VHGRRVAPARAGRGVDTRGGAEFVRHGGRGGRANGRGLLSVRKVGATAHTRGERRLHWPLLRLDEAVTDAAVTERRWPVTVALLSPLRGAAARRPPLYVDVM